MCTVPSSYFLAGANNKTTAIAWALPQGTEIWTVLQTSSKQNCRLFAQARRVTRIHSPC